jgi:hypothetical protein
MVNCQSITALVNQIPPAAWDALRQIKERRPAMMLSELIECRRRAENRAPQNQFCRWRGWVIHPHCDRFGASIGRITPIRAREEAATAPARDTIASRSLTRSKPGCPINACAER